MSNNFVQTNAISSSSIVDGTFSGMLAGKAAETVVAELHGKWWTAAYRGKMWIGSTVITGSSLTTQNTTTLTFGLWNPTASSVVLEPVTYGYGMIATTMVVGTIFAKFSNQTPTSVTQLPATTVNLNVTASASGGGHTGQVLSAGTITAATVFFPVSNVTATTGTAINTFFDFDGRVALPVLGLLDFGANPTQTNTVFQSIMWAEWPA